MARLHPDESQQLPTTSMTSAQHWWKHWWKQWWREWWRKWWWQSIPNALNTQWNRELPPHVEIRHQVLWPLLLVPLILFNQIVTPHPIWVVLLVVLVGLYAVAIYWVRAQATAVTLTRKRVSTILVAGDQLEEEFVLHNQSALPVLWAEVRDGSTLPGYQTGRVVGTGGHASYRWHSKVRCRQRGLYQLGPHALHLADPFGLFTLTIASAATDTVIIYPRVLRLPTVAMPAGNEGGTARRRRPLLGNQPSAAVRAYQPTDSLRHVHWPMSAHRGMLMVKEMEREPSGTIWVLLDLDQQVQRGSGEAGTLEYSIVIAASLTAELLQDDERRAVGLFTISGPTPTPDPSIAPANAPAAPDANAILVPPQSGQAQLWRVLAALAPLQPTATALADLLRSARASLGKQATIMVVTVQPTAPDNGERAESPPWLAELIHLQRAGIQSSVVLVDEEERAADTEEPLAALLARHGIAVQTLLSTAQLPPALTFRRTRRVIRSTPTGGAVSIDVEEEVG